MTYISLTLTLVFFISAKSPLRVRSCLSCCDRSFINFACSFWAACNFFNSCCMLFIFLSYSCFTVLTLSSPTELLDLILASTCIRVYIQLVNCLLYNKFILCRLKIFPSYFSVKRSPNTPVNCEAYLVPLLLCCPYFVH